MRCVCGRNKARGAKARGVLGLPGSEMGRSTLPYLRSLMMMPNTLSTNCGEWKRVAYYVYEHNMLHGKSRNVLTAKRCGGVCPARVLLTLET